MSFNIAQKSKPEWSILAVGSYKNQKQYTMDYIQYTMELDKYSHSKKEE